MKNSFVILWPAFGQYDYVINFDGCPHEYAWGSDKYKISPYMIIPIDEPLKKYLKTPEDDLLDKIFQEKQ